VYRFQGYPVISTNSNDVLLHNSAVHRYIDSQCCAVHKSLESCTVNSYEELLHAATSQHCFASQTLDEQTAQPTHINQCRTGPAALQRNTDFMIQELHPAAENVRFVWGSHDAFQEPSSVHASEPCQPTHAANTPSKAGLLQKRQQPSSSHRTRYLPLAKRMREISETLQERGQSGASTVISGAKATHVQQQQARQLQPAATFSTTTPNVPSFAHASSTGVTTDPGSSGTPVCNVPGSTLSGMVPHFKHTVDSGVATKAPQQQDKRVRNVPASLSSCPTLNAQTFETEAATPTAFLPKLSLTPFPQLGNCAGQPIEAPSLISPGLLQRWLAYKPPPAHYSGLKLSQCVPGSKFLVDSFSKAATKSGTRSFFLTHFHYDHYMGLSKRFSAGTIYCTAETARLVQLKLKARCYCSSP
jgi:hypothetical protein